MANREQRDDLVNRPEKGGDDETPGKDGCDFIEVSHLLPCCGVKSHDIEQITDLKRWVHWPLNVTRACLKIPEGA
jgi:hypothetical protein